MKEFFLNIAYNWPLLVSPAFCIPIAREAKDNDDKIRRAGIRAFGAVAFIFFCIFMFEGCSSPTDIAIKAAESEFKKSELYMDLFWVQNALDDFELDTVEAREDCNALIFRYTGEHQSDGVACILSLQKIYTDTCNGDNDRWLRLVGSKFMGAHLNEKQRLEIDYKFRGSELLMEVRTYDRE